MVPPAGARRWCSPGSDGRHEARHHFQYRNAPTTNLSALRSGETARNRGQLSLNACRRQPLAEGGTIRSICSNVTHLRERGGIGRPLSKVRQGCRRRLVRTAGGAGADLFGPTSGGGRERAEIARQQRVIGIAIYSVEP